MIPDKPQSPTRYHISIVVTDPALADAIRRETERTGETRAQLTRRILYEELVANGSHRSYSSHSSQDPPK